METLCQIVIILTSLGSAWFLGIKGERRKWGFIISLAGQPFWFYTAWQHAQWGVFAGAAWFTFCGIRGIKNHFFDDSRR